MYVCAVIDDDYRELAFRKVVNLGNNPRAVKFRPDGTPLGVWGESGRGPGQLYNPWALAVDRHGSVSVVDSNNHRVQRFRL